MSVIKNTKLVVTDISHCVWIAVASSLDNNNSLERTNKMESCIKEAIDDMERCFRICY